MPSPSDRKYSKSHAWCKLEKGIATVGLTDYAQRALKDIVFAELPQKGASLEQGKPLCSVESVKSVSDLPCPVSGEVIEVNSALEKNPGLLNKDPFGEAWIAKIRPSDESQLNALLDSKAYDSFVEEEGKRG